MQYVVRLGEITSKKELLKPTAMENEEDDEIEEDEYEMESDENNYRMESD